MTSPMPEPERDSAWTRLRRRKVVQWGLGYAAVAWVLAQAAALLADTFQWPHAWPQAATLLLLLGLPVAVVLAWFHGDRGHQRVTLPEVLLLAAIVATGGTLIWRYLATQGEGPVAKASPTSVAADGGASDTRVVMAVLPLDNLSGNPAERYFSDGMTDELIVQLGRLQPRRLGVIARTTANRYRDSEKPIAAIGAELGARYVLEGSARQEAPRVRIALRLIDVPSQTQIWAESYDRELSGILVVQADVARQVASALALKLLPEEQQRLAAPSTVVPAAFDAYLRGRELYDLSADEASEREALAQFDAAIAADPGFAAAHAARARSLTAIANQYGAVGETQALYDAAIAAANRAIQLAPDLADAYSTLGFTLFQGRLDARAAREPFERSRELGGGDARVLARYAQYSARTGRAAEAAEAMRLALELDALNPLIHRADGQIRYAARQYDAAIAPLRRALELNPRLSHTHASIGDALLMAGRTTEARDEYLAEPSDDIRYAGLAVVERRLGHAGAAQDSLQKLVTGGGDRVLYQQAQVLAQWGERAGALDRLERALVTGDSGLIYARNDPMLDPLRDDPRFARLLARLGFD